MNGLYLKMRKLEITLSDKNYQDALALANGCNPPNGILLENWCSQIIESHLAGIRLANQPKLDIDTENRRQAYIGGHRGKEAHSQYRQRTW